MQPLLQSFEHQMENCNDNDFVNREIMIDCGVNCKLLKILKNTIIILVWVQIYLLDLKHMNIIFTSFHHKNINYIHLATEVL